MGDLLAGNGDSKVPSPPGKRVARHAAEQPLAAPYAGRRAAAPEPAPVPVAAPVPYVGRRIAQPRPVVQPQPVVQQALVVEPVPVVQQALVVEPTLVVEPVPVVQQALVVEPTLVVEPVPAAQPTLVVEPVPAAQPTLVVEPRLQPGRRAAPRRNLLARLPSAPLVAGIAILAVSAGGALQAMNPASAGAADAGRLVAANALSGTGGIASASVLGSRTAVVSRSGDRSTAESLQAAADAQAKQRAETLSGFASQAQKQAQKIRLHQWVLPVAPGAYHLTARFGDYSALWASFHTGLDFAAPTGTPIMAVARGTITEVGYAGSFGNRTIETLPDGTQLWYCHQNQFGTTTGATVKPGQVIGYVGSTGNVTGPHLHLEVHPGGGDAVDPYAALVAHGLYPGPPA